MTTNRILTSLVLCTVVLQICLAKPAQVLQNHQALSPLQEQEAVAAVVDNKREQRSPQFGLVNEGCVEYPCGEYAGAPGAYPPPPIVAPGAYPPPPIVPPGEYPVPGAFPPSPIVPIREGGSESSFASASAGATDLNGAGASSQANAESGSFNVGPYSGSFSISESSANDRNY